MVSCEITKWFMDKEVAFAIGVDELPIGGSYKAGPKNEFWDPYFWCRRENNFWTKYWKPLLDKHKWVRYSLGFIPAHNNLTGGNMKFTEPQNVKNEDLHWQSASGKKWIREVLKPIFNYGEKHYDEYAVHGYYHEKGIDKYDLETVQNILSKLQIAFNSIFNHKASVWHTFPFGYARSDTPELFPKYGFYGVGLWSDVKNAPLDNITKLKEASKATRCYKLQIGEVFEPEGKKYDNETEHKAKVGEVAYWKTKNSKIVAVPYSVSIEGSFRNFRKRVKNLFFKKNNFDAPILYYFMHAQMNWIDALGGGSIIQTIRSFLEERGLIKLSKIKRRTALFFGIITIIIAGFVSIYLSGVLFLLFSSLSIRITGMNVRKHDKELNWLWKNYKDKIWPATFSEICEYFDLRKNCKVRLEGNNILIENEGSFDWNGREIPITVKISGLEGYSGVSSGGEKNIKFIKDGLDCLINIPFDPSKKVSEYRFVK